MLPVVRSSPGLVCQAAGEAVGDGEVAGEANQPVGNGLFRLQHLHRHIIGKAPAAPAAVKHKAAALGRPRDVEGRRHGPAPVDHSDGRREDRQAVQEVGGAVEGVQHPERIAGRFLGLLLFLGGLLAQDSVIGEAAGDLGGEVCLRRLVGGGHRVALLLVLELDLDVASEVACQYFSRAAGQLNGVELDFEDFGIVNGLHDQFSNHTAYS